jgi:hypothetical protein
MSVGHIKSTPVTNLDATPKVANSSGKGAAGQLNNVSAYVAGPLAAAGDADSTVQLVRVPWTAIVKRVYFVSATQGNAGKFDLGVYYATDGSNALSKSSLLAADAVDQDFFVAAMDAGGAASKITVQPGGGVGYDGVATAILQTTPAWAINDINKPLWEAAGLTSNPGGNADIVATVTEAPGTGGGEIGVSVDFVLP